VVESDEAAEHLYHARGHPFAAPQPVLDYDDDLVINDVFPVLREMEDIPFNVHNLNADLSATGDY
jgi:hypothetical protein